MLNMEVTSFDDLVQKAEQLQEQVPLPFPRIELNIKQLYEVGTNLWRRTDFHSNEAQASVLLGAKGYDLPKSNEQLEALKGDFHHVESTKVVDLNSFLKNERENAVLSSIEEGKKNIFSMVDWQCWSKKNKDWEAQKMAILNVLVGDENESSDIMASLSSKSTPSMKMRDLSSRVFAKDVASFAPILELIRQSPTDQNMSTLSSYLRESKDFESVLGYKTANGIRERGLIDQYIDNPLEIIIRIANDCEESGLVEEAIKLHDLAQNDDKCLDLLIKYLTPEVPRQKLAGGLREKLEAIAVKIANQYQDRRPNAKQETINVLFLLLDLMSFFDNYYKKYLEDALEILEKLNILPFEISHVDVKANEFSSYADEIRQLIPDILIAAMNIIHSIYKKIKSSAPFALNKFNVSDEPSGKEKLLHSYKEKARLLITYAGMIPYRMPSDVNAKLVQLEVTMN